MKSARRASRGCRRLPHHRRILAMLYVPLKVKEAPPASGGKPEKWGNPSPVRTAFLAAFRPVVDDMSRGVDCSIPASDDFGKDFFAKSLILTVVDFLALGAGLLTPPRARRGSPDPAAPITCPCTPTHSLPSSRAPEPGSRSVAPGSDSLPVGFRERAHEIFPWLLD
jgi:hypothetical protein